MKKKNLKNIISEEIRVALISENTDEVLYYLRHFGDEDAMKTLWDAYQKGHLSAERVIDIAKKTGGSIEEEHDCKKAHPGQTHDEWLDQMTKDQIEHDEETLRKERGLGEVTSKKQKQWACAQINSKNRPKGLSKAEAEEMCRSKVKEAILKALNSQ